MLCFKSKGLVLFTLFVLFSSFLIIRKEKPVFYIIGDSTVKNGDGTGKNNQMGKSFVNIKSR